MKSVTVYVITALFAAGASASQAQNFTFDATGNAPTTVGGTGMDGRPVAGVFWTGTSVVTWADGKKSTDKYTCISTTQPVNDRIFAVHSICDGSNAEGTYYAVFGCQYLSKDGRTMGCVGGLTGKTGKYAGMGGSITFSGRDGIGSGTGTWRRAAE